MKNKTSCSKCTRRKGRSAHRIASRQRGVVIKRLYNIYEDVHVEERVRRLASEKLMRLGFAPDARCLLPSICSRLLIPGCADVFPWLDYRDKLHGLMSFLFRVFSTVFDNLAIGSRLKTLLEKRLVIIGLGGGLRTPGTDRSYRVQKTLFNAANLGTVDKVCILFLLPHVLGHRAANLPENMRYDMLSALAAAQQLIVAVRGSRSYTDNELDILFDTTWITLFSHIEALYALASNAKFEKRTQNHRRNPDRYRAPKRFKPSDRSVKPGVHIL